MSEMRFVCQLIAELSAVVPGSPVKEVLTSPPIDGEMDGAPAFVAMTAPLGAFRAIDAPDGWDRAWVGAYLTNGYPVTLRCREVGK